MNNLSTVTVASVVDASAVTAALTAVTDGTGVGGVTALGVQQPHKLESHRQQRLGSAEL